MHQTARRCRTTSKLSDSLQRHLNAYGLAAGAAGVGMLGLCQTAEAKIVYTKAHITFSFPGTYGLDLSHDGVKDFKFVGLSGNEGPVFRVLPINGANRIWGSIIYASALNSGVTVGPNQVHFRAYHSLIENCSDTTFCQGNWCTANQKYLGLKFYIKGKVHYGWARLNIKVHIDHSIGARLTGYAYETIPNKPIIAGKTKGPEVVTLEPGSLASLAAGSAGR
jgi:hypothetical protein